MKLNIEELVTSKKWKNFMKYLYGWGASVVIIGALFKILHLPGATVMLFAGMGTEAVIFFFSAFEPNPEEYDWALVFPELSGMTDEEELNGYSKGARKKGGMTPEELQEVLNNVLPNIKFGSGSPAVSSPQNVVAQPIQQQPIQQQPVQQVVAGGNVVAGASGALIFTEKFNKMLENSEIGQDLFDKVGNGLRKLSEASKNIADLSATTAAANDLTQKLSKASGSISTFNDNYSHNGIALNESMNNLASNLNKSADTFVAVGSTFADGVNNSIKGLEEGLTTAGNKVAEKVIQSGQNIAEKLNGAGDGLTNTYKQLAESMNANAAKISDGSTSYSQQLAQLNKNMAALNAAHEMHLNETSQRLKDAQKVYAGVDEMTKKLNVTVSETDKFTKSIEMLNNNVASLNSIYGNMLSAISK